MSIENLGHGNGVDEEGDVLPLYVVADQIGESIESNDEIIERSIEAARHLALEVGAVASNVTIDHEGTEKVYPKTVEDVLTERKAQAERDDESAGRYERDDAQVELGGGIPPHRSEARSVPLENVIDDNYQPWQVDIRRAVEQFGMADFSLGEIQSMSGENLRLFSLHFYSYLQTININKNLIIGANYRTDHDPILKERYGDRSPEELQEYVKTLHWLKSDLEVTGVPKLVKDKLAESYKGKNRNELLFTAHSDKKRHHGGMPQVVKVKGKVRVERASFK